MYILRLGLFYRLTATTVVCCILMQILCVVQWRNKVAVGPRASTPKGPPLPPKNFLKTASGKFWAPPQRWARMHCTPCTPYCYATGVVSQKSLSLSFWGTLSPRPPTGAPPLGPGGARPPNAFWCIFSLSRHFLASIFKQLVLSKITITYPSPIFSDFSFQKCDAWPRLTLSPPPIPHLTLPSPS